RLTDWVSLGVLASFVPRDAVDDAIAAAGRQARRSGGKLPPHVMGYFAMALALFADDDYEEVVGRLTDARRAGGCGEEAWGVPGAGRGGGACRAGAGSPRPASGWGMSR